VRLYHVTDKRNRESIRATGLHPHHGMEDFIPEPDRLLWMFTSVETAQKYADPTHSWGGSCGLNDLWAADVEIEIEPDRDRMHEHAVCVRASIPPDNLTLVKEA
jgi:hypothetical protein